MLELSGPMLEAQAIVAAMDLVPAHRIKAYGSRRSAAARAVEAVATKADGVVAAKPRRRFPIACMMADLLRIGETYSVSGVIEKIPEAKANTILTYFKRLRTRGYVRTIGVRTYLVEREVTPDAISNVAPPIVSPQLSNGTS